MQDTEAEPAPDELPQIISTYAATHCANCAAGWTRHGTKGGLIIVCLLDRKAVWHDLAECDRYEPRDQDESDTSEAPTIGQPIELQFES